MRSVQISIPEPCHENWHSMTPTDQGRFCKACAKEVVDFSMMPDREVLNYFSTVSNDKVCGRALPSQLERAISLPKEAKKRLFWYWNYIVMFFMFFSKANVSKAQGNIRATTQLSPIKLPDTNIKLSGLGEYIKSKPKCGGSVGELSINDLRINNNIITGKIKNEEGDPVSFASVRLTSSRTGLSADAEGRFAIKSSNINTDSLIISAGYLMKQVALKNYAGSNISSTRPIMIMGGVISRSKDQGLLYIVDGVKITNINDISAENIENIKLLQPSAATAIYGSNGANGAMVITTKKSKVKTLDTVVISALSSVVMGGMVKGVPIKRNRIADSIKTVKALFVSPSNLINVYPNPVRRGSSFALSIKLKQAGNYNIDIIDASGRILLQKQTNTLSKEYMEQVQTDSRWSSGVYYIRVFDNNNKPIGKLSFIVQ